MSVFAEQSLLSVLLNDNSQIMNIDITEGHFQNRHYAQIFENARAMLGEREVVDVITLAERMQKTTGRDWLSTLTDLAVESSSVKSNLNAYVCMIKDSFSNREAHAAAQALLNSSGDQQSISTAIKSLMSIGREAKNYEYDLKTGVKIGIDVIDKAFHNKGEIQGVKTGLESMDGVLGGFHNSDLIVVAARPAMGKTSILLNMLIGANAPVGCISAEQGIEQIAQRLLSITGRIPLANMRNGKLTDEDWHNLEVTARKLLAHPGIRFYDKSGPSIDDIEAQARRWKFEYGIKALYVDYLQKISRDMTKQKAEAVGDNTDRLKHLARELDIPIICLAQVKREVETRSNKRPMMGDISDSSQVEKEADQVITLYRDEVYNQDTHDKGLMEILIEKNRHGPTGMVPAKWDARFLRVLDMGAH